MDSDENEKKNLLNYFAVKNGIIEKNETLADFSKEFIAHMLDEFKLTDYLEKKYLAGTEIKGSNFIQSAEFTSFVQLTLKMKSEKAKLSNEKKALKENTKAKVSSKKTKKNVLKETTLETESQIIESHKITSNKKNFKSSSSANEIASSEKIDKAINKSKSPLAEKKPENELKPTTYPKQQQQKEPASSNSSQTNSNSKTELNSNKKTEVKIIESEASASASTSSSFLENDFVFFEEPFGNSGLMPLASQFVLSFTQAKLDFNPKDHINSKYLGITEQTSSRLGRFILAMFIVLISSFILFMLVKFSIEWATRSKNELLSLKEKENKEILEEINQTHNLIRF